MLGGIRRFASRHALAMGVAAGASVGDAGAHIDLQSPVPREHGPSRDPNSNVKQGPCGQEANGRTERVTVFEPGATVAVTWVETTNHRSYYRVAFDVDGDDAFPTFAGTGVGAEGIDPEGPCPIDGQVILAYDMDDRAGGSHTLDVRLPDVECERCTLQVVQFMYDTGRPYYFQCADLALRRSSSSEVEALDAGARDAAAAGDAGTAVVASPRAAPGCSSQIAPSDRVRPASNADAEDDPTTPVTPPAAAAGGGPATPAPTAHGGGGGCSLAPAQGRAHAVRSLALLGAWAVSRGRRWRRRIDHRRAPRCD